MKLWRIAIAFAVLSLASAIGLSVSWKVGGVGCFVFGEEYRILIRNDALVWVDGVPSSLPDNWEGYDRWYEFKYSGSYFPIGVFGMLGKFRHKIILDSVWDGHESNVCKETFSKMWHKSP